MASWAWLCWYQSGKAFSGHCSSYHQAIHKHPVSPSSAGRESRAGTAAHSSWSFSCVATNQRVPRSLFPSASRNSGKESQKVTHLRTSNSGLSRPDPISTPHQGITGLLATRPCRSLSFDTLLFLSGTAFQAPFCLCCWLNACCCPGLSCQHCDLYPGE